jgi:hypothetical protein
MDTQQLAQTWADAFSSGNIDAVVPHVANNFVLEATTLSAPQSWEAYSGFIRGLFGGIPDLQFNIRVGAVEGNQAELFFTWSGGTHTADLDLSAIGMGVHPATNGAVSGSTEELMYTMTTEGDKIAHMHADWPPGAGVGVMLKELGLA